MLNEELPVLKRAAAAAVNYAVLVAKGNPTSNNTVNVSTKIINQLSSNRVDTTQGIDLTRKLIATELINAINSTTTNNNAASHIVQQSSKVVVDNQAICSVIASPTKAACSFTINIHS